VSLRDEISSRGTQVRERLDQLLQRAVFPRKIKTFVLVGFADITLELHKAIWFLTESNLNGAAFALVRLPWDAMLRSAWINKVATDQQIEQAWRDELRFPFMDKMRKAIKQAYCADASPEHAQQIDAFLQRYLKKKWPALSSYRHAGGLQISRRFGDDDELKPDYSEGAIAEALSSATVALLVLMHTVFLSVDCPNEAEETGTMLMQWNFGERLRSGQ
jgi:hypothetical protein